MASTLCLGPDHQPQSQGSPRIYRERKARLDDNSFFNLFGAGDCVGAKVERSRARRALPVNTLTGAIIGSHPAHQLEQQTVTPTLSPPRGNTQTRPSQGPHRDNVFQVGDLQVAPTVLSGELSPPGLG